MAKKKEKHSLGDDLSVIKLPFKLFGGFQAVVDELKENTFEYGGIYHDIPSTLLFESKKRKEYITVNISEENLLIRQFSEGDKLKVIYVVKDSGRKFKII